MILTSTQKIQAVLAGAVSANQPTYRSDFVNKRTDSEQPGNQSGELNGVTAVDIVDAPAAMWFREVSEIQIYNADTASVTVTVSIDDDGTSTTIGSAVLAAGETLSYAEGEFSVLRGSKSWLWDESADHILATGDATFSDNVTVLGTLTVGENGTGHDVTLYGDTAGKKWLWDESADKMIVTGDSQFTGPVVVGVDATGYDVQMFGDTTGKSWLWSQSADQMVVTGTSVLNGKVSFSPTLAGTDALIAGAGKSGATFALGSTAGNALEFYLDAAHTSGDMRGMYLRTYFSGVGGGGEALRAYSTINNKTVATGGTVNGAHISLNVVGANGKVSGQASALRATFDIASASTAVGGTCSVLNLDTVLPTEVTVPPNLAFIRFVNLGVKKAAAFFRIPVPVAEEAGLVCAHVTDGMTHSLRIVDEAGTAYYLMATTTVTNRTVA